jgi:hypothetical protein
LIGEEGRPRKVKKPKAKKPIGFEFCPMTAAQLRYEAALLTEKFAN